MTTLLILSRAELRDLTGTGQPKRMSDWLTRRGWVFEPAARRGDTPKVDRAYYVSRMSGATQGVGGRARPKLDFMRKG